MIYCVGWLCESEDLAANGEAYCSVCETSLRAHRGDLKKHALTKSHIEKKNSLDVEKQPKISKLVHIISTHVLKSD